ncbi:pyocin knob domain-containing protein [Enterococcus faecalis]|uniref:pyocin knob domain-containing protein n=1 Tax=Enterococcus faecalis TaxID=1351 RepID=UPI0019284B56|nr:pyocin knob domain-containing protein [Enterococcus faecalis]MDR0027175.1 pyocin knob domain-containing protein [Enterococcus faecalis]
MAKLLSKKATTEFTQVAISSTEYQDSQLEELTVLSNIKQTSKAQAYSNNKTTVSATAAINNEGLTEGYYINTVGLYATDPDKGEILYSVSTAKVNGYMPPDIGVSKSGFSFTIYTEVGNAEQVDVTVDPSGYANKSDIQILSERITKNKNDSEEKFIPKLSAENGLFVRKNSKILDLNDAVEPGIYSIPATGVENKPLPNSGSLMVNKDPGGVRQLFQTERTIVIRQFGGIPSKWTDWKEVSFTTNVVNLTEPQKIGGIKDFDEIPLVNQTPVMLQKEQLYEAWYTPGKDHNDLHNRSRFSIGAEYSNVGKRLGLPMRSNPLQWNDGRWLATVLRDCKLNVRAVVKIQAEGSRGIPYAYVHLGKGYEEATGDMGTAGGTGAITGINYKNFIPVELNVSLKKGDYFSFYLEMLEGKNINFVQMISAHITELV